MTKEMCFVKKIWRGYSKNEWLELSNKYNIKYVFSGFIIPNLSLCQSYLIVDKNKPNILKEIFYYKISEKSFNNCTELFIRNNLREQVVPNIRSKAL